MRFALGDSLHYAPDVRAACDEDERFFVAGGQGPYPHTDTGMEVRRILHRLLCAVIENFNELFEAAFDIHGLVPTKGEADTARLALKAVFIYQLALVHRHEQTLDTNCRMKAFLRAA